MYKAIYATLIALAFTVCAENTFIFSSDKENRRLNIMQEMLGSTSVDHLGRAGIRKGMVVWDVSCGNGAMTEIIAGLVGNTGHVYALDTRESQIRLAKERIKKAKLSNVTFVTADLNDITSDSYRSADLVCARFFLAHLTSPINAIRKMASLLKVGGVMVLEEFFYDVNDESLCPEVELRYIYRSMYEYNKIHSLSYSVGRCLTTLCAKVDALSCREDRIFTHYITPEQRIEFLSLGMDSIEEKLISAGITTKELWKINKQGLISAIKSSSRTLYPFSLTSVIFEKTTP